jgi:hypothetical protein
VGGLPGTLGRTTWKSTILNAMKYLIPKTLDQLSPLDALNLAIQALNEAPNFNTWIVDPKNHGKTLPSYRLIPYLEKVVKDYEDQTEPVHPPE